VIERLPRWAFALVIVGVGFVVLVLAVLIFTPQPKGIRHQLQCMDNQGQLAQTYLDASQHRPGWKPRSGPPLWLEGYGTSIKRGEEKAFVCPADPLAELPETDADRARYELVDLAHVPRSLCSYAGRDFERFPIDAAKAAKEPLGACVHHAHYAIVVFADGAARKMTLDELGLASDDDKVVGPDSKSPVLRVLRYGDGSVR
jgi:hypothetical protein